MKRTALKRRKPLKAKTPLKAGAGLRRGKRLRAKPRETQTERERKLSKAWIDAVVPKQHRGTHEGHHVIPQEKLKKHYAAAAAAGEIDLPAVLWDARNGLAVRTRDHARHTTAFRKLRRADLRPENIAFAEEHGFTWYIEKHYA